MPCSNHAHLCVLLLAPDMRCLHLIEYAHAYEDVFAPMNEDPKMEYKCYKGCFVQHLFSINSFVPHHGLAHPSCRYMHTFFFPQAFFLFISCIPADSCLSIFNLCAQPLDSHISLLTMLWVCPLS
jgi:hypothetical protein